MKKLVLTLVMCFVSLNSASAGRFGPPSDQKIVKAVREGNVYKVQKLIDKGANVNAVDTNSMGLVSLLHIASIAGNSEIVSALIDRGANLEATTTDTFTAFLHANSNGHVAVMRKLFERGANVEATDKIGNTALHVAASNGNLSTVQFLLNLNLFDVNELNGDGKTPLMLLANIKPGTYNMKTKAYLDTAKALIEAGADVNVKTTVVKDGNITERTALSFAMMLNKHSLQVLLKKYGASEEDAQDLVKNQLQIQTELKLQKEAELARKVIINSSKLTPASAANAGPSTFQQATNIMNTAASVAKAFQNMETAFGNL